jgi:ABC-type nickel/cobalt efflux system permease component RcnA
MESPKISIMTIWLLLVAVTLFSWAITEQAANAWLASISVILIAAFKIYLIFEHFMELKWPHKPWWLALHIWLVVVTSLIIGGYIYTAAG